ncbi:uncharacterized protein LOC120151319 [Hibiscus syriacus]|uniref:uncharacterized protein LOC120151319 n=1 Tax=Hibiscus syriacus TaxID=106335 RepID=UPI0019216E60|nr:uncharacterized protein LOC120151319 [Hibiscus syriacus]
MVILDRLPTKDRLARFGLLVDNVCGLCGAGMESRDHLFDDCSFARGVWGAVLNAHGPSFMARAWDERLHWLLSNLRGKTLRVRALKLLWTGFPYLIWEERNHRYHRNLIRSIDVIVNRLLEEVSTEKQGTCKFPCSAIFPGSLSMIYSFYDLAINACLDGQ